MEDRCDELEDLKICIDDPKEYQASLRKNSLKELIDVDTNLSEDISVLEDLMRRSVYKNYHKLVKTTEIIHGMDDKIGDIRQGLILLETDFKTCLQKTTSLVTSMAPVKEQYKRSIDHSDVITSLELIIHLPESLNKLAQHELWEDFAQKYYAFIPVIEKLNHHECVHKIYESITGLKSSSEIKICSKIKKILSKITENKEIIHSLCCALNIVRRNTNLVESILLDNILYWLEKFTMQRSSLTQYAKNFDELIFNVLETLKISVGLVDTIKFFSDDLLKQIEQSLVDYLLKLKCYNGTPLNLLPEFSIVQEKIFRISQKINYLFDSELDKQIDEFASKTRDIMLEIYLRHLLKKTFITLEAKGQEFKQQFNYNVTGRIVFENLASSYAQDIFSDLKSLEQSLKSFYDPDSAIFCGIFLEEIHSKFICLFFKDFLNEFKIFQQDKRVLESFELILFNSMALEKISQFLRNYDDHEAHKEDIQADISHNVQIYENESKVAKTLFVERCTEIFFITSIRKFMANPQSNFNYSIFRSNIIMFDKIMSIFENYKSTIPCSSINISFKFTSDEVYEFGIFNSMQEVLEYYEIVSDCDLSACLNLIYKLVAKSILEIFMSHYYAEEQVVFIQQFFFEMKRIFSEFCMINKKTDNIEKKMILILDSYGYSSSNLLSLHKLNTWTQ